MWMAQNPQNQPGSEPTMEDYWEVRCGQMGGSRDVCFLLEGCENLSCTTSEVYLPNQRRRLRFNSAHALNTRKMLTFVAYQSNCTSTKLMWHFCRCLHLQE